MSKLPETALMQESTCIKAGSGGFIICF